LRFFEIRIKSDEFKSFLETLTYRQQQQETANVMGVNGIFRYVDTNHVFGPVVYTKHVFGPLAR